jgi:hypothetical protein
MVIYGLDAKTKYDYYLVASDINGNESTKKDSGSDFHFTTNPDPEMDHEPLSKITFAQQNPSVLTDTDAVISFTTDQSANCTIEYGPAPGVYSAVPVQEGDNVYSKNHSMHLMGLIFLTKYYYKVNCVDNLDTSIASDEKDFTTMEKLYTESGAGALGDHIAPVISNVNIGTITGESAIVTWDTDEKANSVVGYGITATNENGATDQLVNSDKNNFATTHTVILTGLIPATKYVYIASSTDAAGNIAQSSESSFTTASPSSLSSIKAESKSLGQATITWNTSTETTSVVEYGLTTSYGEKKESTTQTKEHSIDLSNLNQGVIYHFRVKGEDKDKKLYASSDQTFEPKSPPQISNISINDITEHEAKVSFETNVPTSATVVYTSVSDAGDNGSQTDNEMATQHSIQLKNLSQGTTFSIKVVANDEQGTESEQVASDLTTGKDENPPKIDMVKTDLALAQNDKVQAIISWSTDEQSTTSILYKEGRNGEQREIEVSKALTPSHIAVVTSFKPGTVYYFNTKSVDASGNTATSTDYALLTPKRKENIIQIIINNFQGIFSWANR